MSEEGRALMTDREREIVAGETDVTSNYEYKVRSLVRNRVRKQLQDDVDVLEEDLPEVYEMIESAVCGDVSADEQELRASLKEARGEVNALAEEIETLQDQLAAAPDRGEIEAAIEDLEAACEQGDRNGVDVALDRLREAAGIDDE